MKVILLKDVPKVGRRFDIVTVADGFAANMLFPRKLAEPATAQKVATVTQQRQASEALAALNAAQLEKAVTQLDETAVTIAARANEKGHLYKAIHLDEVLAAITEQKRVQLPKDAIELTEQIKSTGEHRLPVSVGKARATLVLAVTKA